MGLFGGKSCPRNKEFLGVYGIHPPTKWKPEDCKVCEFTVESKCVYKPMTAGQRKLILRGQPVQAKKSKLYDSPEARHKAEAEAVQKAEFSEGEEKEYWVVSEEYEAIWSVATPAFHRDVIDRLDQLKINLEKGERPSEAAKKVLEWVRQKDEWKAKSG